MSFTQAMLEAVVNFEFPGKVNPSVEMLQLLKTSNVEVGDELTDYIYIDGQRSATTFTFVCLRVDAFYAYFGLKQAIAQEAYR